MDTYLICDRIAEMLIATAVTRDPTPGDIIITVPEGERLRLCRRYPRRANQWTCTVMPR